MNRNIFATIMLVLAVGIYLTVTQGVLADAGVIKSQNDQYDAAIAKSNELLKQRKDINEQFKKVSDDQKALLAKMLPDSLDNIRLIIDLNNIAYERKLILKGVKATSGSSGGSASVATAPRAPGPAAAPSGLNTAGSSNDAAPSLQTVTVSFGVSATYAQFIELMRALEKNLRIMDLTHLSLSANNTGTYDYTVELQTYWLKPAPGAAPAVQTP